LNTSTPFSLNCNKQLIGLKTPVVMGIINATPDSFYDGGTNLTIKNALTTATQMLAQGATFLDIGGYSSRPGATNILLEEELDRVLPVISAILEKHPEAIVSIDTFRSQVAQKAIEAGACIVNDITAGLGDPEMLGTVAKLQVTYVMMHMRGTPQTMKSLTDYEDLMSEVKQYFSDRISAAKAAGIKDIIIDPGFGFAKNTAQNFTLLKQLASLQQFNVPILAGLSRKSMIYKTLDCSPQEALNGTTALNALALQAGTNILRVHDVAAAIEVVKLYSALKK